MPTLTKLYTMQEAAKHNTSDDCWVVVDGKVYDVTDYLDEHPGGDEVLLKATGKDATDEFEDAGHSKGAIDLMQEYCIGELDPSEPVIPVVDSSAKEPSKDVTSKFVDLASQYWAIPVAIVGVSVVVAGFFLLRKKHDLRTTLTEELAQGMLRGRWFKSRMPPRKKNNLK